METTTKRNLLDEARAAEAKNDLSENVLFRSTLLKLQISLEFLLRPSPLTISFLLRH